jgi:hypothetical protein
MFYLLRVGSKRLASQEWHAVIFRQLFDAASGTYS